MVEPSKDLREPLLADLDRAVFEHSQEITAYGPTSTSQKVRVQILTETFKQGEPGKCLAAFRAIETIAGFTTNSEGQKVLLSGEQAAWPTLCLLYTSKKLIIHGKEQDNPIHRLLGKDPEEFRVLFHHMLEKGEEETLLEAANNFRDAFHQTKDKNFFLFARDCYLRADEVSNSRKYHYVYAKLALEVGDIEAAKKAHHAHYEWKNSQGDILAYRELAAIYEELKDTPKELEASNLYIEELAKRSELNVEFAHHIVAFCEDLKAKGPNYTELAKKGLLLAGKKGCMQAFISLGKWESNQSYFIQAFALASTLEEFLQVIQALNDDEFSTNYLENFLRTPIVGNDQDIAISKGRYLVNAINALAELYSRPVHSLLLQFPHPPEQPHQFSYPDFECRAPTKPNCCKLCCYCCCDMWKCLIFRGFCKTISGIVGCPGHCCSCCYKTNFVCQKGCCSGEL